YWRGRNAAELAYTDPAGLPALRAAISHYLRAYRGVLCEPDQVVVVGGTQAGIDITARVLLEAGETVWVEDPGYGACQKALLGADARLAPVPVDEDGIQVEAGEQLAPDARLAFVAPAHQYPTGAVMSLERRLALLDWARRAAAWVLEDDYDGEFRYGRPPISTLHALDQGKRVIYLGTLSKVLAPALRVGYLIVPHDLHETFAAMKAATDRQMPIGEQAVAAEFIASGRLAAHVRRLRTLYGRRREALRAALSSHLGELLDIQDSGAGLHFMARFASTLPADTAIAREAQRRGLGVRALSTSSPLKRQLQGLIIGFANVPQERA
ncbi:aminotransferase-like domain-containing protein, partial [Spiribacter halobius]